MKARSRWWAPVQPAGAALAYTLLALAWTWPLAAGLTRDLPWDLGDPLLNCWILAWHFHQAGRLLGGDLSALSSWWHPGIFHPTPYALGHSELLAGQAAFGAPVYLATGNIILTYNVLFIASIVLSGVGMYLLVRDMALGSGTSLPARQWQAGGAGFVAGLLYAFALYRVCQGPHLQVLSGQWLPFVLWGLHRWWDHGRLHAAVWAGVALGLQNLSNGYYLIYAAMLLPPYVLAQMAMRGVLTRGRAWIGPLVTMAVGAAITVPLLTPYLRLRALGQPPRPLSAVSMYSADTFGWLTANDQLWWWGSRLRTLVRPEGDLFPGLVPLVLAAVALAFVGWRRWSSRGTVARAPREWPRLEWIRAARSGLALLAGVLVCWHVVAIGLALFAGVQRLALGPLTVSMTDGPRLLTWLAASLIALLVLSPRARAMCRDEPSAPVVTFALLAVVTIWLSFGPIVHIGGRPSPRWPSLYAAVYAVVPGADALRVPPRIAMITALALSVLGGLGAAELLRRRAGLLATGVLALAFMAEGWAAPVPVNLAIDPAPLRPPPAHIPARPADDPLVRALDALPPHAVLVDLPFGSLPYEVYWQYLSIGHWRARVNGYSGDVPQGFLAIDAVLSALPARGDEAADVIATLGVTHVILHAGAWPDAGTPEALRTWLRGLDASRVTTVGQTEIWQLP